MARLRAWLGGQAPARDAVNHVALGTFCHAASALRDAGLRRWTGPFDWIFSTPAMIEACLADDFAALLDPGQLESVPAESRTNGADRQCRHPAYEARYGLPILFNHHDPARLPADRRALERAVGRLRAALAGPGRNCFYMLSEYRWPEEELGALAARLDRYPSRNLLVVIAVESGPRAAAETGDAVGRLDIRLSTGTRSRSVRFGDPADDELLRRTLLSVAERAGRPPC